MGCIIYFQGSFGILASTCAEGVCALCSSLVPEAGEEANPVSVKSVTQQFHRCTRELKDNVQRGRDSEQVRIQALEKLQKGLQEYGSLRCFSI